MNENFNVKYYAYHGGEKTLIPEEYADSAYKRSIWLQNQTEFFGFVKIVEEEGDDVEKTIFQGFVKKHP